MDNPLMKRWNQFGGSAIGRSCFARMIGFMIPYTGTIHARVMELRPGFAKVVMKDKRRVRNHLNSIHAIAQMNLAELSTGLALNSQFGKDHRAILTGLSIEYLKKARGTLTAVCNCENVGEAEDVDITGEIMNQAGEVVSRAHAKWRVGKKRES